MAGLGEVDYRTGARERLEEAFVLLRRERWSGSIYLAGRAVEGMLRAVIWRTDKAYAAGRKTLQTGHDLRRLWMLVGNLDVLPGRNLLLREAITSGIQRIARLWSNNMRYWPTGMVKRQWLALGEIGGRRTMKKAAQDFCDACLAVIRRCEELWQG